MIDFILDLFYWVFAPVRIFWFFGALAVGTAILSVTRRNPVYAAFFLLLTLGALSVEFLLLHAPFIAAMQIILYAGAIVVLFVFVIMLLSLKEEELGPEPPPLSRIGAAAVALVTFGLLSFPAMVDQGLTVKTSKQGQFRPLTIDVRLDDVFHTVAMRYGLRKSQLTHGSSNAAARLDTKIEYSPAELSARKDALLLVQRLAPAKMEQALRTMLIVSAGSKRQMVASLESYDQRLTLKDGELRLSSDDHEKDRQRVEALTARVKMRADRYGSLEDFVGFLYSRYVVAFELVSVLIFAAIAGVIVLARRRGFMGIDQDQDGPAEGTSPHGGMFL